MIITSDLVNSLDGWQVVSSLLSDDLPLPVALFRTPELADEFVGRSLPGNYKVETLNILYSENELPLEVSVFLDDVADTAEGYGVDLVLSPDRSVDLESDHPCNGYFETDGDDECPVLAVACGQPLENWLLVLIHESCHMDQWIEGDPVWTDNDVDGAEPLEFVMLWVDKKVELSEEQLDRYVGCSRVVELNCERRSVEKIEKYNLPVNVEEYIQKANAYVFFYTMMKEARKWYKIGTEPYNVEEVWKAMPTTFLDDDEYNTVPDNLRELYLKHIF